MDKLYHLLNLTCVHRTNNDEKVKFSIIKSAPYFLPSSIYPFIHLIKNSIFSLLLDGKISDTNVTVYNAYSVRDGRSDTIEGYAWIPFLVEPGRLLVRLEGVPLATPCELKILQIYMFYSPTPGIFYGKGSITKKVLLFDHCNGVGCKNG